MTTVWVGVDVHLRMVVCHGLLKLAVLFIITIDEEGLTLSLTLLSFVASARESKSML
jgi:hypothetical protein